MCATLHVLWSLIYITCGAVQLVVGIFFLVANMDQRFLRLGSNVLAGGWNVVVGVTGALVACVGPMSSPGRHEALLYMAVSVLAMNAVNLAVLEIVEWKMLFSDEDRAYAEKNKLTDFIMYARVGTSSAALLAMLVSFFDSQLTFCSLQHAVRKRLSRRRSSKGLHHGHHGHGHHGHGHHHDHSADSEYIILPRVRPSTKGGYEQYTRSWVFDVDGNGAGGSGSARYQQLDSHAHADKCRDAAAAAVAAAEGRSSRSSSSTQRGDTYTVADAKAMRAAIANGGPPPDSGSPGMMGKQMSRQQKHKELMREREQQKQAREQQQYQQRQKDRTRPVSTSSSSSPAPSGRHQQQSHKQQSSGGGGGGDGGGGGRGGGSQKQVQPVIEESPPSGTSPDSPAVDSAESRSPDSGEQQEQEGVGYHSLMSELTQVIRKKPSPKDDTSSADFNRELEAALQDIHDLDSSTGGTLVNASSATSSSAPPPPAPDWGDSDEESSASSRTLGKRRSQPPLGRAFAIPVPPPVPPPESPQGSSSHDYDDCCGTLRATGTLRAGRTATLTNTLRRQWDQELLQIQQSRRRGSTPSPPPPPPPPPMLTPPSPVRTKTVVTICDGDMVVREMNNNDVVLLPVVLPAELGDGLPPAPLDPPPDSPSYPSPPPSPLPPPSATASSPGDAAEDHASQGCSLGSVGRLGGLSLLRKGRSRNRRSSNGCTVRLSQELQGAVLQSESLVFLSDSELVARHERNRRVQREIEQRVQQQISGHLGGDSLC